jgi:hypothetical protein
VVVGLDQVVVDKLDKRGEKWRVNGRYGLIMIHICLELSFLTFFTIMPGRRLEERYILDVQSRHGARYTSQRLICGRIACWFCNCATGCNMGMNPRLEHLKHLNTA